MAPPRDRRPGFSRRAQYGLFASYVLAVAGAAVGIVLLVLSTFNPPTFAALRSGVAEITAPVSNAGAAVIGGVASIPDTVATYFFVHDENARLRAELKKSEGLILRARAINYDNRRLRSLLKMRDATPQVVVTARIVSSTASSTRRFGLLYAGVWQGVREGQPVNGPSGLIGRVVEVGPNTARVQLVTDPETVVPVRRTRDGLPAIVAGRGDGLVDVRSVGTANAKFQPGDLFVTSGVGGIYAPGVPVAKATARGADSSPGIPYARPDTLDFAVVAHAFLPPPPAPRRTLP